MFVKVILTVLCSILGGVVAGVLTIVGCFLLAMTDSDPSAGGAYVAMAMLFAPGIAIACGGLSGGFFWRWWK